MKIEHCEFSHDNGEDNDGNTMWYCPRSKDNQPIEGFCPYDCCEKPKQKVVDEPVTVEAEKKPQIEINTEKYAELVPVIQKLVSEGTHTWTGISRAVGLNSNTLRSYYNTHGIKFAGMKAHADDINWESILPTVREKRALKKPVPWKVLGAELGINSEMLRVRMINYYDIN